MKWQAALTTMFEIGHTMYYSLSGHVDAGACSYSILPGAIQKQAMARILKSDLLRALAGKPPRRQRSRKRVRPSDEGSDSETRSSAKVTPRCSGNQSTQQVFLEELKLSAAADLQCLEIICLMLVISPPSVPDEEVALGGSSQDQPGKGGGRAFPRPTLTDYLRVGASTSNVGTSNADVAILAEAHKLLVNMLLEFLPGKAPFLLSLLSAPFIAKLKINQPNIACIKMLLLASNTKYLRSVLPISFHRRSAMAVASLVVL
jgi:hypothetical protein